MQDLKVSEASAELKTATIGQARDPLVGTILMGRYQIEQLIACGGMGRVYRGQHMALAKPVAIKLLHSHLLTSQSASERFFKEAQAASALRHPAIASVSDFGESESGEPFIVMDFIPGQPLSQRLQESKSLPAHETIAIAYSVLSALKCCHNQSIVHRDLKPSNIILSNQPDDPFPAKVVDFGIAKLAREEADSGRVTATGEIFGSPYYMSPEQCQSNQLDGRTDIYALGCVLYECLSGAPPFTGRNLIEILMRQCSEEAPDLSKSAPNCPKYLADIIHAMLEKSPDNRPASAEHVLNMLQTAEKLSNKTTPVLISKAEKQTTARVVGKKLKALLSPLDSTLRQHKVLSGLLIIVLAGSAFWFWGNTPKAPVNSELEFTLGNPINQQSIEEVDALIERGESERMSGLFFESRQSFEMAATKCMELASNTNQLKDRAALAKIGQALVKLEIKDLADLHVSPVFGKVNFIADPPPKLDPNVVYEKFKDIRLLNAQFLLEEAVKLADSARTYITAVDADNTVAKLPQKLKATARIYLAALQFLNEDFDACRKTLAQAQDILDRQSLVLNNCEIDLMTELQAELYWQEGKYLDAARLYSQSPRLTGIDAFAEPDNNFAGRYLSANHDYKLILDKNKAKPFSEELLTGSWQDLTLTPPNNASRPARGILYDRYAGLVINTNKDSNKPEAYFAFHIGKTLLIKGAGKSGANGQQVIIMHNVKQ